MPGPDRFPNQSNLLVSSIDKPYAVGMNITMRTLLILRHAKSSWATPGMDDHDRPLNERGNADAAHMGEWIGEQNVQLDEILCSTATRTRATAQHIVNALGITTAINYRDDFYLASAETIRSAVATCDNTTHTAMVIGHNPGLHDLVLRFLTKDECNKAGLIKVAFPTASCALIKLPIDNWNDIAWNTGALSSFMAPKSLNASKGS